jgi:hypothetical protein
MFAGLMLSERWGKDKGLLVPLLAKADGEVD